jgi:peptidoglycan/xylan/chitin deacetylase (PgdA/CDA1 family)
MNNGDGSRPTFHRPAPRILMYHSISRVPRDPNHVCVPPNRFAQQMAYLRRRRLRGVSIRELLTAAAEGTDRGLVGLTFDDGFDDYVTNALPVLQRLGFTATLFPVVDLLGSTNVWDRGEPTLRLIDAEQASELAGTDTELGSHALSHPRLTTLDDAQLDAEVIGSRERLSEVIGRDVPGFCYPYGDHDARVVEAVRRAGYDYACAYQTHGRWDRLTLPRTHVGQPDGPIRLEAKLQIDDRLQQLRRRRRSNDPSAALHDPT